MAASLAPPSLAVVPGVELSASASDTRVHILGYFADFTTPHTEEIIQRIRQGHLQRELLRLARLRKALPNLALTEESLLQIIGERVPNWRLVATALVRAGDAPTVERASELYLRAGTPGYLSYSWDWQKVPTCDAVRAIVADGGLPFIAHPGDVEQQLGSTAFCLLASKLREAGLAGFELTASTAHHRLSDSIARYLEVDLCLVPIYGSDFHGNGPFVVTVESSRNRFLRTFLAHYGQSLPGATLQLNIQETILPVQCPTAHFAACGEGAVSFLHQIGVTSVTGLLAALATKNTETYALIPRLVPFLRGAVAHSSIELGLLDVFDGMEANEILDLVYSDIEAGNAQLVSLLASHLGTNVGHPLLELQYPLGYRLCRYDETLVSRDAALEEFNPPHYSKFASFFSEFAGRLIHESAGLQVLDETLAKAVERLGSWEIQVQGVIRRGLKSPVSAYEKLLRSWLGERLPLKSGSLLISLREASPEYYSSDEILALWPDLFAATIVLKGQDEGLEFYSKMMHHRFGEILDVISDLTITPRRWYHNRLYLVGRKEGIPIEIMVKTNGDYWLSRFYYWMTKNGRLFFDRQSALHTTIPETIILWLRSATSERDLYLPAWFEVLRYMSNIAREERMRKCLKTSSTSILSTLATE